MIERKRGPQTLLYDCNGCWVSFVNPAYALVEQPRRTSLNCLVARHVCLTRLLQNQPLGS